MAFGSLFSTGEEAPPKKPRKSGASSLVKIGAKPRKPSKKELAPRGCDACPANNKPGVTKIMGRMFGRKIWIVGQSPGPDENEEGREFVGPSGDWLWSEVGRVGITRDMCDIVNAVRCFPADLKEGSYSSFLKMRPPLPEEIRCCSLHLDDSKAQSKAQHILILGQIAQKAFLNTRSIPAQKVFWSEEHHARIYLADHPSFFIRGYGGGDRLAQFRSLLDTLASDMAKDASFFTDPFAYIKQQDYCVVSTYEHALKVEKIILAEAKRIERDGKLLATGRVVVDIEDDDVEAADGQPLGDAQRQLLAIGFCWKPGMSRMFVFDDPRVLQVAKRILENPKIKKAFQYGCSDTDKLHDLAGIDVQGYDWDTNFAEYMCFPDRRKYGLDALAEARFPEFSGYKAVVAADIIAAAPDVPDRVKALPANQQMKYIEKNKLFHLRWLKRSTLRLYNGADCDLTKRAELSQSGVGSDYTPPAALVRLFIDLSYVLKQMEANGPLFDYSQQRALEILYDAREVRSLQAVRDAIGDPEFNPDSPKQVHDAIYYKLDLEYPFRRGKPNTRRQTMLMLSKQHPFPQLVLDYRKVSKAKSTYILGYKEAADVNGGFLRTVWWSTGTRTTRLSSGGGGEGSVNLQNIHGNNQIQNMLVSDKRWRKVYNAIGKICKQYEIRRGKDGRLIGDLEAAGHAIEAWVQKHMPDLEVFLILDYGQVEVRVAAQLSGDKNLRADCASGDIHTKVGVTMTHWPADRIKHDKRIRTLTKNVHFGILFGAEKSTLYDFVIAMTPPEMQSTITREEVEDAYDRYFERYDGVRNFIDNQREFAEEHKYVETAFGFRRPLNITERPEEDEEVVDEDFEEKASWRNQAINTPVQGTAHNLLECGLVNLRRQPVKYKLLQKPAMDVHDAFYSFVRVLQLPRAYRAARYLMEKESLATVKTDFPHIKWDVPIMTEAEAGFRLGTRVELSSDTTAGSFMLEWFFECRDQLKELDESLKQEAVSVQ